MKSTLFYNQLSLSFVSSHPKSQTISQKLKSQKISQESKEPINHSFSLLVLRVSSNTHSRTMKNFWYSNSTIFSLPLHHNFLGTKQSRPQTFSATKQANPTPKQHNTKYLISTPQISRQTNRKTVIAAPTISLKVRDCRGLGFFFNQTRKLE